MEGRSCCFSGGMQGWLRAPQVAAANVRAPLLLRTLASASCSSRLTRPALCHDEVAGSPPHALPGKVEVRSRAWSARVASAAACSTWQS